jgi:hypothetical protein
MGSEVQKNPADRPEFWLHKSQAAVLSIDCNKILLVPNNLFGATPKASWRLISRSFRSTEVPSQ